MCPLSDIVRSVDTFRHLRRLNREGPRRIRMYQQGNPSSAASRIFTPFYSGWDNKSLFSSIVDCPLIAMILSFGNYGNIRPAPAIRLPTIPN